MKNEDRVKLLGLVQAEDVIVLSESDPVVSSRLYKDTW